MRRNGALGTLTRVSGNLAGSSPFEELEQGVGVLVPLEEELLVLGHGIHLDLFKFGPICLGAS